MVSHRQPKLSMRVFIINTCGILLRNPQNGRELKVLKWKLGKRFKKINTRWNFQQKMSNFIKLVTVCFLCDFFSRSDAILGGETQRWKK